uniref:Uncharacterized protein n=1 Tax=Timema genevievae TaxID=629358 RepID=A0A7R9PPJ9_TIMGE|nr:unnamed protein product [Timema genevievae]
MSGDYSAMPEEGIILNALAMVLVALGILLSYAVRRDSFRTELAKFGKTHLKPYFNSTVQVKKQGIPILFRFALLPPVTMLSEPLRHQAEASIPLYVTWGGAGALLELAAPFAM